MTDNSTSTGATPGALMVHMVAACTKALHQIFERSLILNEGFSTGQVVREAMPLIAEAGQVHDQQQVESIAGEIIEELIRTRYAEPQPHRKDAAQP